MAKTHVFSGDRQNLNCSRSVWVCSAWLHYRSGLIILGWIWISSACLQISFSKLNAGFKWVFNWSILNCVLDTWEWHFRKHNMVGFFYKKLLEFLFIQWGSVLCCCACMSVLPKPHCKNNSTAHHFLLFAHLSCADVCSLTHCDMLLLLEKIPILATQQSVTVQWPLPGMIDSDWLIDAVFTHVDDDW